MAHEIESRDGLVLNRQSAWHGLGTIVHSDMTARQGLAISGIDRKVVGLPLSAQFGGKDIPVPGWQMNAYEDAPEINLGIVGSGYRIIQNAELADFCDALATEGDTIKIESAGSIRNGAKVWFLLRGESFAVRGKDEVFPYICVSNGHDGATALRATYTTVRVVCSNTLHMVIPKAENERTAKALPAAFVCSHTSGIMSRIEEARSALGLYNRTLDSTRQVIDEMAAREVGRKDVEQFFLECYTSEFGAIPSNPKTEAEKKTREKAVAAWKGVNARFENEHALAGSTVWNLFNAWTGWVQNDRPMVNFKDAVGAAERRQNSKLFGTDAERADTAFRRARKLVV